MAPKSLPPRTGEAMLLNGAVVLFGPDYLENSLLMVEKMKDALAGRAVLSCERIEDLRVPDGPVLNCSMVFFHRMPARMDFGTWDTVLLKDLALDSRPPKGLGVDDQSPEKPNVELVPVGGAQMQLIVTWTRPLEASHIVRAARALERAYLEHGGQYDPPSLYKSLRGLFS